MHQRWADYRLFWREFRQTFHTTGAVLPSGRRLAKALTRHVREDSQRGAVPRQILEVGPGTGSVSTRIIRDMQAEDRLVMVERNEQFVERLRHRLANDRAFLNGSHSNNGDGRISLVHASLEELPEDTGSQYDLIVSGLPLNNFPIALVEQLLAKLARLLAPGGTLSFFEYIAIRRVKSIVSSSSERERLRAISAALDRMFQTADVEHDCVLANVPPAWVHHVRFK